MSSSLLFFLAIETEHNFNKAFSLSARISYFLWSKDNSNFICDGSISVLVFSLRSSLLIFAVSSL